MKHIFKLGALAAAAVLACAPLSPAAAAPAAKAERVDTQPGKTINKLADEYYDAVARFEPVYASEGGDNRFIDQLGLSIAPKNRERQFALYRDYLKRLQAIPRDKLSSRDQTSYDILKFELDTALRLAQYPEHLLPVDQMVSMPVILANYASGQGAQPLSTVKDYKAYLNRLTQLTPWIDQAIVNMRAGIKAGIVHPRAC